MSKKNNNKQKSKKRNHTKRNPADVSVFKVVKDGDPRLLVVGVDVNIEDQLQLDVVKKLGRKMSRTLIKEKGVGIAHHQCNIEGDPLNVFVMRILETDKLVTIVNPRITYKGIKKEIGLEGCLSFPDKAFIVNRSKTITVKYYSLPDGKEIKKKFSGNQAIIFQHELQHLQGITIATEGEEFLPKNINTKLIANN